MGFINNRVVNAMMPNVNARPTEYQDAKHQANTVIPIQANINYTTPDFKQLIRNISQIKHVRNGISNLEVASENTEVTVRS